MSKNIPIIYYHSTAISKNLNWFRNYLTLELKYFEEHLKYFNKHKYEHIFLKDLVESRTKNDLTKNNKFVCLTFDDGYLDNFIYAYPLLKKYNAKATIFINPVFVDKQNIVRKTLEDYWLNKATLNEINKWGFLSWDEMRKMEQSRLVDIQSHTLTHTMYFVSDKIIGFHHPKADCLYYIGNEYPERLPYYIEDKEFNKLLPFGYPVFESKSSIIARKVTIRQSFIHSIIQFFKEFDWNIPYHFGMIFNLIKDFYEKAIQSNAIIESIETENEYKKRVYFELKQSKEIIEKELNKKVEICCWPHGDSNKYAHETALEIGYKATSIGKVQNLLYDYTRYDRFGLSHSKNNMLLSKLKMHYKLESYFKQQPYYFIKNVYEFFRNGF